MDELDLALNFKHKGDISDFSTGGHSAERA